MIYIYECAMRHRQKKTIYLRMRQKCVQSYKKYHVRDYKTGLSVKINSNFKKVIFFGVINC